MDLSFRSPSTLSSTFVNGLRASSVGRPEPSGAGHPVQRTSPTTHALGHSSGDPSDRVGGHHVYVRSVGCSTGRLRGPTSRQWCVSAKRQDHFEPSQFQTRCSDGWRRLKATAVPSLFLHSESQQPAARTSGATLQVGLLTQPLPTTSGACFVSIFQGPAYPRVAIPPRSSPQVTSDNQRGQASSAARGTLVSAHSTSWQPAARTSGAALQGGLLTQPLPTTSGACFVSIFQGPAYPSVAIPPHPSLQVTSDNQRGQASAAALGTLVSAASTSWMSRKIKQLENENHRLVRQAALQKTREATFRSHLHKFFTADQLAALSRSSNRGSKWSNEMVKKSLQMRFACGSLGYDLLLEGSFPLPSSRTLGRRLEGKFVVRLLKCFKAPC
ncbi:hypothetical protein ISCGN_031417 [Ixodes scapularis]